MFKKLFLLVCILAVSFAYADICKPAVNKKKPKGIAGGQFTDCHLNFVGDSCNPLESDQNYMSRHHIFDKHDWINVLDRGLNHGGLSSEDAKKRIVQMLKTAGASQDVINDLDNVGYDCKSGTNSWLTWLPVNLSLGPAPQDRSFDPNNNFDRWALLIVPGKYQNIFLDIKDAMARDDGIAIASDLAVLPAVENPWSMTFGKGSNWTRAYDDGGKEKYCPTAIFDQYGLNKCPNHDIQYGQYDYLIAT